MTSHLENIPFVCSIVFGLVAALQKLFPPRKINSLYGYRTTASMRSQQNWDFAQRYSVNRTIEAALFLAIAGTIVEMVGLMGQAKTITGLVLLLFVPLYLIVSTERALKKKFPK